MLEREDLTVLAYRFEGDKFCVAQRFAAYEEALGDRFVDRVLPDSTANTDVAPFFERRIATPYSVVTGPLRSWLAVSPASNSSSIRPLVSVSD